MKRDLHRETGWVFTFTGGPFWPMDPQASDVRIVDIAHGLSNLCRFAGQTRRFYSVAQHSVLVSEHCPAAFALFGLLHDASEAYLVDITVPVKQDRALAGYRAIEERVQHTVYGRFGLAPDEPGEVKRVDRLIAETEIRDLIVRPDGWWEGRSAEILCLSKRIIPVGPEVAKRRFLQRFSDLTGAPLKPLLAEARL